MVNVTISLPDETLRKLRETVKERYGGKKGALSGIVNEALEEHIGSLEKGRPPVQFRAYKGERLVAEAATLDELSSALRRRNTDPRAVRIVSSTPLRQVVRAGMPGKRT